MTTPRPDDASSFDELPTDIPGLEAQIATLEVEQSALAAKIKHLMADEDPAAGRFHHQEIFAAQQDKLRLTVQIKLRRNKINALRFGSQQP